MEISVIVCLRKKLAIMDEKYQSFHESDWSAAFVTV